jgi:hypothetical protein
MKILEGDSSMTFWENSLELSGPSEIRKNCKFTDEVTMDKTLTVADTIKSNNLIQAPTVECDAVIAADITATNAINAPNITHTIAPHTILPHLCRGSYLALRTDCARRDCLAKR